jgi:hypothetical protein
MSGCCSESLSVWQGIDTGQLKPLSPDASRPKEASRGSKPTLPVRLLSPIEVELALTLRNAREKALIFFLPC